MKRFIRVFSFCKAIKGLLVYDNKENQYYCCPYIHDSWKNDTQFTIIKDFTND